MHQVYIDTWMKFDYRPYGRISFGFGYDSYELDAYYLLEIDPWGRRFYHRGGMRTGAMNRKIMNATALNYDKVEGRHTREHFGHMPPNGEAWEKQENKEEKAARSLEDKWREIEQEMTFEPEVDMSGQPAVVAEQKAHGRTVVVREVGAPDEDDDEEGETSYQIVGTWTAMREPQEMTKTSTGTFTYEVSLGPNGWEQFYLLRSNSWSKKIYPAVHKSTKDMPCVGPHKGRERQMCWQLTGRPSWDLPGEDEGPSGSRYLISFTPGQVKRLTWEKLEEEVPGSVSDSGTYQILGSWACFDPQEMTPDPARPGVHTAEVQCTRLGLMFHFLRNLDYCQNIAPQVENKDFGNLYSGVAPIGQQNAGRLWKIESEEGEVYRVELHRDPGDLSDIRVTWEKVGSRPSQAVEDRYFLVGSFNRWGYAFEPLELRSTGSKFQAQRYAMDGWHFVNYGWDDSLPFVACQLQLQLPWCLEKIRSCCGPKTWTRVRVALLASDTDAQLALLVEHPGGAFATLRLAKLRSLRRSGQGLDLEFAPHFHLHLIPDESQILRFRLLHAFLAALAESMRDHGFPVTPIEWPDEEGRRSSLQQLARDLRGVHTGPLQEMSAAFAGQECPLCLELWSQLPEDRAVAELSCGHAFCEECLGLHVQKMQDTCPSCRRPFGKTSSGPSETARPLRSFGRRSFDVFG
ncbi:unnamed protein product [Effrenium voratum]|nr:unnamed protein product [Effrenium voratum]